jgi:N-acetyl-1-D-myo-inositol-2-amino-2-deoxy-alpha-D-glucopyranoside deacetylase
MADNYRMFLPITPARRILLVHAHPDDETIGNGATMAKYRAEGAAVTLVTCTRGEEGEVLVPALADLAATVNDELGEYRVGELARAMLHLGITDHLFLGTPTHKYRDSGMIGTEPNNRADCFWQSDLEQAAAELVEIIRDRKPQVLITYDENGGYGHPDHIKAHLTAMRAAELAADPTFGVGEPWEISTIYWNAIPRSAMKNSLVSKRPLRNFALKVFKYVPSQWITLPFVKPDSVITTAIDGSAYLPQKLAALREHKTQLIMNGDLFEFTPAMGVRVSGTEHYICVKGLSRPTTARAKNSSKNWESDLFAD